MSKFIEEFATPQTKKHSYASEANYRNDLAYWNILSLLILKALERYEYEGLPDEVDVRMLELSMIMNGTALIGRDPVYGLMSLRCSPDGNLNVNGYNVGGYGTGLNGYNRHFNFYIKGDEKLPTTTTKGEADAVMFMDNAMKYPFYWRLQEKAMQLADTQRSLDVIARMLKAPLIITADKKTVPDIVNVLQKIDTNIPYIVGLNALPYDTMKTLDTGVKPESLSVLYDYYCNLQSQADELIGINGNPEQNKKERMLVDEVNSNNMRTGVLAKEGLKWRKWALDNFNAWTGSHATVKLKFDNPINYDYTEIEKEGEENERNETGKN